MKERDAEYSCKRPTKQYSRGLAERGQEEEQENERH